MGSLQACFLFDILSYLCDNQINKRQRESAGFSVAGLLLIGGRESKL